jgi:hypothetical protein
VLGRRLGQGHGDDGADWLVGAAIDEADAHRADGGGLRGLLDSGTLGLGDLEPLAGRREHRGHFGGELARDVFEIRQILCGWGEAVEIIACAEKRWR